MHEHLNGNNKAHVKIEGKKCTLWFLSGAFVNFGKFWKQILSEGKVCVLAIKNYIFYCKYLLFYQNVPCFSVSFPMKFLGKSARRDVKKNKLCAQYYSLNIIVIVYTKHCTCAPVGHSLDQWACPEITQLWSDWHYKLIFIF